MTLEEWKERLPLIQAFVEGKRVQLNWDGVREWKDAHNISFENPVNSYRIAPEPKLRPWTVEEVPDCWVRIKGSDIKNRIVEVNTDTGFIRSGRTFECTLEFAFLKCEHSTDGGKTWKPCGVLEGEK